MDTPDIRSLDALRREGWTRKHVRGAVEEGALERIHVGRFTAPAERTYAEDHVLRTIGAWQARSDDHVVSHTSAAIFHGPPVRQAAVPNEASDA